jgi:hypothetical protein
MVKQKFQHVTVSGKDSKVNNYTLELISDLNDFFYADQTNPAFYTNSDEINLEHYKNFYNNFPNFPIAFTSYIEETIPFSLVSSNFSNSSNINLHPSVLKYENSDFLFYERKPFKANVSYKDAVANSTLRDRPYSFWVPWTLYCFNKNNYYDISIFFSDKELQSFEDSYIFNFFPNSYSDGKICTGMSSSLAQTSFDKGNKIRFESFINDYWSGGWNNDLSSSFHNILYNLRSSINEDDYPIVSSYLYFSEEVLFRFKNYFPTSKFKKLLNSRSINYSYNNNYSYDRLLSFLSVLTLEETLMFFSEIKLLYNILGSNSNSKTFEELSKNFSYSNSSINFGSPRLAVKTLLGHKSTDIDNSIAASCFNKEESSIVFIIDENYFHNSLNDHNSSFKYYVSDYHAMRDGVIHNSSIAGRNIYDLNRINQFKFSSYFRKNIDYFPNVEIFNSLSSLDFSHFFVLYKEDQSYKILSKISFYDLYFIIEEIIQNEDYTYFFSAHKKFDSNSIVEYGKFKFIQTFNLIKDQFELGKSFDYVDRKLLHSFYTMFSSMIVPDFYYYFNNYFSETNQDDFNEDSFISTDFIKA